MSAKYQDPRHVPLEKLTERLDELADAITRGGESMDRELTMRIPAECDRDADLVIGEAASRLTRLQSEVERLRGRCGELEDSLTELIQHYSETWDLPILRRAEAALDGIGNSYVLARQAEAVEKAARLYAAPGLTLSGLMRHAQRLRQQAAESENG